MALAPGTRLGPYEVLAPLGAGGMGEVYRARDTRLDRTVAVKVLPEHIAQREDARSRFEREARAVASPNHAHICTLHDIGPNYMAMELIEGETLADRLEKGPIPLNQAIQLAAQIADALDRAHRAGVTHRDVKPGNIMFTRDGVKVLDFGLAKSASASSAAAASGATLTRVLTTEGTLLGTPQYMAPEQFEGKEADARSDIWAFGAVLYEMVTGRKAFEGKNYTSMVAAILGAEPAPMAVKPFTPSWLERLVRRCLEKDPEDRWQSMRDIVLELRSPATETAKPVKATRWPWTAAAGFGAIAAGLAVVLFLRQPTAAEAQPMEFEIRVPAGALSVSVSPNGKYLAWRDGTTNSLWIRPVETNNARKVENSILSSLAWSPDSKYLAYVTGGAVKKVDVQTTTSQVVNQRFRSTTFGLAWTADGYIVMGEAVGPLTKVHSAGGASAPALPLDEKGGELQQQYPLVLPDGRGILFTSIRSDPSSNGIYFGTVDGKTQARRLYRLSRDFQFIAPSTLLVVDDRRLLALPFDLKSATLGDPLILKANDVSSVAASEDGRVLALRTGSTQEEEVALYDRSGKKIDTFPAASPVPTSHLEFSPDGRRLLLERYTGGNLDLWTVDIARKAVSRLTFHTGVDGPGVWSADGQKVYFRAVRPDTGEGIFEVQANGTGEGRLLHKTNTHHLAASPDGAFLMFERTISEAGLDYLDLKNGNTKSSYIPHSVGTPQFSPDSRFVAYESSETGKYEVYVQTFPAGGGKWQISTAGGIEPRWRGDGREIFFDKGDGTVMSASIEYRSGSPDVVATKELFRFRRGRSAGTAIAVTPDGKTFAIREAPVAREDESIIIGLNWKLRRD